MSFLKDLKKNLKNPYASIVSDGIVGDVDSYIDTGSFMLNALVSASIFKGIPSNKITVLAGKESVGKTIFTLSVCKHFLDQNKNAEVVYFESEGALTSDIFENQQTDVSRILIAHVDTVEDFRYQIFQTLDAYMKIDESKRHPLLICLDSFGNLSTKKEMTDVSEGKETADMTRARLAKSLFRVISLKLAEAKVPLIITNHVYDEIGPMYPQAKLSGGSGISYLASNIILLSKRKDKEGSDVVGNLIRCTNKKARLTVENKSIDVSLRYDTGLNRHYGLLDFAERHGIIKKSGNRFEMGSKKLYAKEIYKNPDLHFTDDLLQKIDEAIGSEFHYGSDYKGEEDVLELAEDISEGE